jgi:hypothetical protein
LRRPESNADFDEAPSNPPTIAGPLSGTNWTFTPLPGSASGFYRLRCE